MNDEKEQPGRICVTAYPVYAVRVVVEAAAPQEAMDNACEAVDWLAPERAGLPGAAWVQLTETWESFSTSDGEGVEWFGPDGLSALGEPQAAAVALRQCPDLPDDFHWANRDAVEAFEQAFRRWCDVRDAALSPTIGQETPRKPCQHDWQPTDTECHSMECTRCGALWTLAEEKV